MEEIDGEFYRRCPECNILVKHSTKNSCKSYEKENACCRKCSRAKRRVHPDRLEKICPCCQQLVTYKSVGAYSRSVSENQYCRKCYETVYTQTPEYKAKVGAKSTARGAGGLGYYRAWIKRFGQEKADELYKEHQAKMSDRVSGSKNPCYGVQRYHRSGRSITGWYKGWFFRSLMELSYVINYIEPGQWMWESAEKSQYIIYYEVDGVKKTYRADFIINNKWMIEIKPLRLHSSKEVLLKKEFALEFCRNNNLQYQLIDCGLLDAETLKKLYINQIIKLSPGIENRFLKFTNKLTKGKIDNGNINGLASSQSDTTKG